MVLFSGGLRARAAPTIAYIAFDVRGHFGPPVIATEDFVSLSSPRVTRRGPVVGLRISVRVRIFGAHVYGG